MILGAQSRIRTYSPEGTDLQSAATLQLSRLCVVYSKMLWCCFSSYQENLRIYRLPLLQSTLL